MGSREDDDYWNNKSWCHGCEGTCCTGWGSEPCTCTDPEDEEDEEDG